MYIKTSSDAIAELNLRKVFPNVVEVPLNHLSPQPSASQTTNLATQHNSPLPLTVNWYYNCVQVIESTTPNLPRTPPTRTENDIKGFSRNSRKNMINKLAKLNLSAYSQVFMATFTYHNDYPTTRESQKKDIDLLQKKLLAKGKNVDYFWRIELQKRGAPHFHYLLCFKQPQYRYTEGEMLAYLIHLWRSVLKSWDKSMQLYAVHCKDLKNVRSSLAYMSKYIAKEDELREAGVFGRRWGTSATINLKPFKTTRHTKDFIEILRVTILRYLSAKLTVGNEWSNAILHAKTITVLLSPKEQCLVMIEAQKRYQQVMESEQFF